MNNYTFSNDIMCEWRGDKPFVNIYQDYTFHGSGIFEWGCGGKNAADLALNILTHFVDKEIAFKLHQEFKWDFIAKMPREGGIIKNRDIKDWIKERI